MAERRFSAGFLLELDSLNGFNAMCSYVVPDDQQEPCVSSSLRP
jgi:hypothetical protein